MIVEIEKTESLLAQLLDCLFAVGTGFLGILAGFTADRSVESFLLQPLAFSNFVALFESVSIPPAGQEAVVVDADAGAHLGRGKGIRRLNVFATAFIESLFSKNKKTIRIDCNFLRWK
jgi:hypothetical protein